MPNTPKKSLKQQISQRVKSSVASSAAALLILSFIFGFIGGTLGATFAPSFSDVVRQVKNYATPSPQAEQARDAESLQKIEVPLETAVVNAVESASPSVVSVVATKDVPVIEQYYLQPFESFPDFRVPRYRERGTEQQQVSAGTGFVASEKLVITNRHVVEDAEADYTVITASGHKLDARVITRDPVEDLAILEVPDLNISPLPLSDSDDIKLGSNVIAIGNALGEFENSVSTGVVSGLGRTITASGGSGSDTLREVIQTDAAINFGNSGGPLLNLQGEVIGINVAKAAGAENIGFAIPVNRVKNSLNQAKQTGEVKYPFLGVSYILITPRLQEQNNLPVDYGALVIRDSAPGSIAVVPGSAADRAGIEENDIILAVNDRDITLKYPLDAALSNYSPGDTITLKIYHKGEQRQVQLTLGER